MLLAQRTRGKVQVGVQRLVSNHLTLTSKTQPSNESPLLLLPDGGPRSEPSTNPAAAPHWASVGPLASATTNGRSRENWRDRPLVGSPETGNVLRYQLIRDNLLVDN
jgi:hypothetical protein